MKIHLRQIPHGSAHFEGEEPCPLEDVVHCLGPLHYDLEAGLSEGALWVNGTLAQKVELNCVVCLEEFPYEIKVPTFAVHLELHGPETIDLTPFMREDLLLNLPAHPHCDRDSGRTCAGAKLASGDAASEEEAKREHDWEALDKLKLKS